MSKITSLFKKAWNSIANPDHDQNVQKCVALISNGFSSLRDGFNLSQVLRGHDFSAKEIEAATRLYYDQMLERFWGDGVPNQNQVNTLDFVAKRLQLPREFVQQQNTQISAAYFGAQLGSVLSDGVITQAEFAHLAEIAKFAGMTVPDFAARHLQSESLSLLKGLFADATSSGYLNSTTWTNLVNSAAVLGLNHEKLIASVMPLTMSFAEHVLADIKSDGRITTEEKSYLSWLATTFRFPQSFLDYLRSEVGFLEERERVLSGNISPVVPPSGFNLTSGEIAYLFTPATLRTQKKTKFALIPEDHRGYLLITDNRFLFQGSSKNLNQTFKSIVSWVVRGSVICLSVANKPEIYFFLPQNSEPLLAEKIDAIVRLHNQRLTRKVEGTIDRHIPRAVRARVWQRYGGRCADCQATDYLEFDHIIPVAKGGSNSEQNVQLLCRKCNQKKSDNI